MFLLLSIGCTDTPSPTPTPTPTDTPVPTPTTTPTPTPTNTPTPVPTPTNTPTPTPTPTNTPTPVPTPTNTPTPTPTPTNTPTPVPTPTNTPTPTPTPTPTNTPTPVPTPTNTPTITPTPMPTNTPTITPTSTKTPTPTITPTPFVGAWEQFTNPPDPLTDRRHVGIRLTSFDLSSNYADATGEEARLYIRCTYGSSVDAQNGLEVFIAWDDELVSEQAALTDSYEPTVDIRFDAAEVQRDTWSLSTTRRSTFALTDYYSIIVELKSATTVAARVRRYDDTTITAQWNVAGFRDSMKPVEEKCPAGAWRQMTGHQRVGVYLWSFDYVGGTVEDALLEVRCASGSYIDWPNGLAVYIIVLPDDKAGYEPSVSIRFDDAEAREDAWAPKDGVIGLWVGDETTPLRNWFISEMKSADRLVARVMKKDGTTITAQWYVTGFREAVKPIEEKCAESPTSP